MEGLKKASIAINRKMLADLAVADEDTFKQIVARGAAALKAA
jgi:ribosomal protein L20